MLKRLRTAEVVELFGDPLPYWQQDGTVARGWEQSIITYATMPAPLPLSWNPKVAVSRFKAHKLVAPLFTAALAEAFNEPEVWATVNDFGGCYEFRGKRLTDNKGLEGLSLHSWGVAIDLDARDNPQRARPRVHPRLIAIMASHGFLWGGTFPFRYSAAGRVLSAPDAMHFEFADLGRLTT